MAVRPGSFRRYRLHRIPSVGSVCFSKRSGNFRSSQKKSQNKRSSKRLSCFYLAPYRNPPGPSDLGWRSSGATVCVCSGHGVGWAIASAPSQFIHRNPPCLVAHEQQSIAVEVINWGSLGDRHAAFVVPARSFRGRYLRRKTRCGAKRWVVRLLHFDRAGSQHQQCLAAVSGGWRELRTQSVLPDAVLPTRSTGLSVLIALQLPQ